ncbi:MAG: HAD family phosphatase [Actinomycetaceae bacterium]|nr:HAD family phosphatase [Arcanobacterium sp.]MDD7687561.1 HAD family phosphatase [Actinomycetaceae bacterium]MDY5273035.1 HAD family phosphatase [Arcanobacterium sp.]
MNAGILTRHKLPAELGGITAVVFDIGGVLVTEKPDFAAMAHAMGLSTDAASVRAFVAAFWKHRDEYDRALPDDQYWRLVARDAGAPALSTAVVRELVDMDCQCWVRVEEDILALLRTLADRGYALGILSNAPSALPPLYRSWQWARLFRAMVFSSEVGMAKPDPHIYAYTAEMMRAAPEQILFFDDRQENVSAARQSGLHAYVWEGVAQVHALLNLP